jgi:hypothetical protein
MKTEVLGGAADRDHRQAGWYLQIWVAREE